MLILLPPSETKRPGGSRSLEQIHRHGGAALHGEYALGPARARVHDALRELCLGNEDLAVKTLKLGVKNRDEFTLNVALMQNGTMPAIERYTGVLYDALNVEQLGRIERDWVNDHVMVQSALFGLLRANDLIPAYRLSASTRLPALSAPLKKVWCEAHEGLTWDQHDFVLDLRSKDYAALAPVPAEAGWYLNVVQRGEDGTVRALNHFNKAAKGDLVRRLALLGASPAGPVELCEVGEVLGLELSIAEHDRTITLVTELGAPGS